MKFLDDVMRELYRIYYKEKKRGFTDAEFQQLCEQVAGISLTDIFEYVYTTKEIDFARYLGHAGLGIHEQPVASNEHTQELMIYRLEKPNPLQLNILSSWMGE
jgi:predicted metalloprotease with PDZ domain